MIRGSRYIFPSDPRRPRPRSRAARSTAHPDRALLLAADRSVGRVPRRCLRAEHPDRLGRIVQRARRPEHLGHRRSLGGPCDRHVKRAVELRPGLGGRAARCVRDCARCKAHCLLPPVMGRHAVGVVESGSLLPVVLHLYYFRHLFTPERPWRIHYIYVGRKRLLGTLAYYLGQETS